ncbi:MAG: carbonic anhydrase [Nitrospirae bacterium]|nr:carbonic anhydrase [Nitrospirota bacterium]
MTRLVPVNTPEDIFPVYRGTAIEQLLQYHNLVAPLPPTTGHARMLISMCMDHRKDLVVPGEFAYVLRSAGGNLRDSKFEVSYAIGVGGVSTVALLAHTDCGMAHVTQKRSAFVSGLVKRGGWTQNAAEAHFDRYAERYQIGDPITFVCGEAHRLQQLYPPLLIVPMMYDVETDRLMQIIESPSPDGS